MKRMVVGLLLVLVTVLGTASLALAEGRPSWPVEWESATVMDLR